LFAGRTLKAKNSEVHGALSPWLSLRGSNKYLCSAHTMVDQNRGRLRAPKAEIKCCYLEAAALVLHVPAR
jgi:hypothetical protein